MEETRYYPQEHFLVEARHLGSNHVKYAGEMPLKIGVGSVKEVRNRRSHQAELRTRDIR